MSENEKEKLQKIFDGLFKPLFELKNEMNINDLHQCFPRTGVDALTSFMTDFARLELVTLTAPWRWKIERKDH